jgi:shikimate dehydrogenase
VRVLDPGASLRREGYDLVVNATPAGIGPDDPHPFDLDRAARVGAVLDLAYQTGGTPWVGAARAAGIRAADGTEMLLHQGAAAFRRWFGVEPDIGVMRGALG